MQKLFYRPGLWGVFLLWNSYAWSQDASVVTPSAYGSTLNNYVRSWVSVKPDTTNADITINSGLQTFRMTTQYIDGLGKPVQTIMKEGSYITGGTAVDLVIAQAYDSYEREPRMYLPFGANSTGGNSAISNGLFKSNPFQEQNYFYSNSNTSSPVYGQGETYYYGKKEFETSPLDRVATSYGAGDNWVHSGNGISLAYDINTSGDSVRIFRVVDTTLGYLGHYTSSATFAAGDLTKLITTDERGYQEIEYKDKQERVVLKKVQLTASADNGSGSGHVGWLCTYYIYDVKSQLRAVLQPAGVAALMAGSWVFTSTILNEQCFRYEYDGRRRMIIKKVPGAGAIWTVYDQWDRLLLLADSNLRAQNKWMFTKYDALDRPVVVGFYTDNTHLTQASMQAYVISLNMGRYETFSNASYPEYSLTNSFPSTTHPNVQTYTYYDAYTWSVWYGSYGSKDNSLDSYFPSASNTVYPYPQPLTQTGNATGLVTGVWDATGPGLLTATFYDDYKRVLQTKSYNYTGGTDITTMQYSFTGQPVFAASNTTKGGTNTQTTLVLTQLSYDSLGRESQVQKKVSNSTVAGGALPSNWETTVQNSYNSLGQLTTKKLGNKPGGSGTALANQAFVYNIRGWLLSINKAYVDAGSNSDQYFGMELGYDKNASLGTFTPSYNGNISGLLWKGEGDQAVRKYDLSYDATNRLLAAGFNQYVSGSGTSATFNKSAGIDYSVSSLSYDANGNIGSMVQKGWKLNSSVTIDSLSYGYQTGSNKLNKVTDGANDSASLLSDFHYRPSTKGASDYSYDGNGNLITDNNKAITSITYNYLNLPSVIQIAGGSIQYWYDAAGNKLKKQVVDWSTTPHTITNTLYVGGNLYRNDTLQLIGHEEGRARVNSSNNGFVYDYFLKDHLGNVRMTLTEEGQTDAYPVASLEAATIANERIYYGGLDSGRVSISSVSGYPSDTYTLPNSYTQQLSGASGAKIVGSNVVIKVMAGDTVNLRVSSWYRQNGTTPGTPTSPLASLVAGLAGGIMGADPSHFGLSQLQQTGVLDPGITNFLSGKTYNTAKPKAFLNWILFDEQFRYVAGSGNNNSGFQQVGNDTTLTVLTITGQIMSKSGYFFVYVSNETPNINVYFDNLQLTHMRGRILDETHYYPFGLAMTGISSQAAGKLTNNFRYNDKELQRSEFLNGASLEWYDYGARMYDPQIGRFFTQDPHSYRYATSSPYNYAFNNPIINIDPDGRDGKVSGTGTADDPYTITANYYYYDLNEKQAKGFKNAIAGYNNGGKARRVKVDGKEVYVTFNLSATEVADKVEASTDAQADTYEDANGSTKRFGNIVNADFKGGGDDDEYGNANSFEISLNGALIDKNTTEGKDVDGKKAVLDYNKLIIGTFEHEIGHNLTGLHGDPGGLMDKVNTSVQTSQIGGTTQVYTTYQSISRDAIKSMIMRINKPYKTDYAKDADYIQAIQSGKPINLTYYGTSGQIYSERKN